MRVIKESMGRDYRAIRAAVDVGTRNHKGERDGGLSLKWMGAALTGLIILVRTFAPLFGVDEGGLPSMETFLAALSLTFGVEGFYLFRRSYDLRREDKHTLMQLNRSPSSPPQPIDPPPLAPFIVKGEEVEEAKHDIDEMEADLDEDALPSVDHGTPLPSVAQQLLAEAEEKKQKRAQARAELRSRFGSLFGRNKTNQAPPAAEDDAPSADLEPRPSGAQPPQPEKSASASGELHRPAPVEEGEDSHPSGDPSLSSAPSGAQPLTSMIPPLPRPPHKVVAAPVMFPEEDGLGDLDDDPEQRADDEDRETGAAPGRSAMGGFSFEDDDFDNSFAPFADDPAGGVEGFETESKDVEQPPRRPRGRAGGPRGRAPDKPTR